MLSDYIPRREVKGFAHRTATSYPSGRIWPHDEFSYGMVRPRGDGGAWHEDPYVGLGVDDVGMAARAEAGGVAGALDGCSPSRAGAGGAGQSLAPLNLRDTPNSQAPRKRGKNGITGYGRNMVKAAGAVINRQYPNHRVTFGTITLPPMPPEQRRAAVECWSEIVRQTLQRLAHLSERKGLPKVVVSVSEIQPRRLQQLGEGYLHLHLIWLNHPGKVGNWTVDPCDVRSWFGELLERLIPGYPGGHVNVNVKPVDGQIARYMAKYMSKGSEQLAEAWEDWGFDAFPSTWWNMTAPIRKAVKAATLEGPVVGRLLESLVSSECTETDGGLFAYLRPVQIWLGEALVNVGWRGRMHPPVADDCRSMIQSATNGGF